MDINPNDFKSSFDEYEYANHVVENESELVFFSCAWCDFEPPETDTYPTIAYWAARLTPIIQNLHKGTYPQKNCYFLCANRIGNENGTFFVGASCVLSLKEPQILAQAGRREEKVLFVEIPL
jgi:protein N-terminal amidase